MKTVMKMDFFADKVVGKVIGQIIEGKDTIMDDVTVWKATTRRMFTNYPAIQVWNWIQEIEDQAYDEDWFEKAHPNFGKETKKKKKPRGTVIKTKLKKEALKRALNDRIKITEIAEEYGLKVKGNTALCPFHADKDPSLSFSDEKNVFNCFGCGAKGDLIEFKRKMMDLKKKNDNKKRG